MLALSVLTVNCAREKTAGMNENKNAVEEVRRALGGNTNARGHRMFSKAAAALAVEYANERIANGASPAAVSEELGLNGWTLQRWLQRERQRGDGERFVELKVKAAAAPSNRLTVCGPCGVRIEGIQLAEVAQLLQRLSCSA